MTTEQQSYLMPDAIRDIDAQIAEGERIAVEKRRIEAETELRNVLIAIGPDQLEEYTETRRQLEIATMEANTAPNGKVWLYDLQPYGIAEKIDPDSSIAKAAMAMSAAAYRGYIYPEKTLITFSEIWKETRLEALAARSYDLVNQIHLQTSTQHFSTDLAKMRRTFHEGIGLPDSHETVVVTGLNGTGKSTAIEHIRKFLQLTRINTNIVKFPRLDGPFGKIIEDVLAGREIIDPQALQFLMLADRLDQQNSEGLQIHDRDPFTDVLIYGPSRSFTLAALATRELRNDTYFWTIVVDRFPASAFESVQQRNEEPRNFERVKEQMVNQLIKAIAMTDLPGCRWVNTDIPKSETDNSAKKAADRVLETIIATGVLGRTLLKQGRFDTLAQAQDYLDNMSYEMH